ncbi:MAG: hypothetical protein MUC61_01860 [Amoebophilaceae bacterium]|nr:hypothetical protein [Amoebophilaceae bacterium]
MCRIKLFIEKNSLILLASGVDQFMYVKPSDRLYDYPDQEFTEIKRSTAEEMLLLFVSIANKYSGSV